MLIKVTEVGDVETKREGKRRWKEIRIDYETADKEDNYKLLLDWANPDAYADAQDCESGKFYDVKVVKAGKFWNWDSITESDATEFDDKPSSKSYGKSIESKGTDWAAKNKLDADRFEFEKDKQGLIIRQSCIGYAIQFCGVHAGTHSVEEVIQIAARFEDMVLDGFTVNAPSAKTKVVDKRKERTAQLDQDSDDLPA